MKKFINKLSRLAGAERAIVFAGMFAVIGASILALSHAATPNNTSSISAPTNFISGVVTPSQVTLTWTASSTAGITGYSVLRNGVQIATTDSVTTNFLDTDLSPDVSYTYSVVANQGNSSSTPVTLPVTTASSASTQVISQCAGQTLTSGNYILNSNLINSLPGNNTPCFQIGASSSNLSIDCQNNSIDSISGEPTPIEINNSTNGFLITNCTFMNQNTSNAFYSSINCTDSSLGVIENNTFTSPYSNSLGLGDCSNMIVSHNSFVNSTFGQQNSNYNYIGFNTLSINTNFAIVSQLIGSGGGSYNIIDDNNVDGGAAPLVDSIHASTDDGIGLGDQNYPLPENNDTIINNNIKNVFDTGIETAGLVENSIFANNKIDNAWNYGIGGWYGSSFTGNTLTGNQVTNASMLFEFFNSGGPAFGQTKIYLQDNTFTNNTFSESNYNAPYTSDIDGTQQGTAPVVASNNTLTDNNFGFVGSAPSLGPTKAFIDGGGNICSTNREPLGEPIKCNNPSSDTTPPLITIASPSSGASLSGSTVPVTVNATDNAGVTEVFFYVDNDSLGAPFCYSTTAPFSCNLNATKYTDGSHVLYAIAYDTAGNSSAATLNINVTGNVTTVDPSTPNNFKAAVAPGNSGINVSWDASTAGTNPIAGYKISAELYENGQGTGFPDPITTFPANELNGSIPFTEIEDYQEEELGFFVSAIDSAGNASPASNVVVLDINPTGVPNPPAAPTSLKASANGYSEISLSWTPSITSDVIGYNVYSGTSPTTISSTPVNGSNLVSNSTKQVTYGDTNLNASTTYYYYVESVDGSGSSSASNTSNATTQAAPTPTTTTVSGVVTSKAYPNGLQGVSVHTNKGGAGGIASASTNSSGEYILTNIVPNKSHTYTFSIVGYKTRSIKASYSSGTINLNIVLKVK